jgi:hypothetical protein
MVLLPKKNQVMIYRLLFQQETMGAKKGVQVSKHQKLADKDRSSLLVMKAMQVLQPQGSVKEEFA